MAFCSALDRRDETTVPVLVLWTTAFACLTACGPTGHRQHVGPDVDADGAGDREDVAPVGRGGNGGGGMGGMAGGGAGGGGTAGSGMPDSGTPRPADANNTPDVSVPDGPSTGMMPEAALPPDAAAPDAASSLTMGLVSRWKLDEGTGTTTADSVGANPGTFSAAGATWSKTSFTPKATFPNPGCVTVDGTAGYVRLGIKGLPANNKAQTVALWVNYAALPSAVPGDPGSVRNFISLTDGMAGDPAAPDTGKGSRLQLGFNRGRIGAWKRTGTTLAVVPFAGQPTSGWHHFAYTFDATTHRFYIDGKSVAMSTTASDTGAVASARLGSSWDGTDFFHGEIDDARIYDRALAASEVADLFAGKE